MAGAGRGLPTVLVVGPTPPPYQGVSVVTANILKSALRNRFRLVHLEIADRRTLANVGRVDLANVLLAIQHGMEFLRLLVTERPRLIHLTVAETTLGFLRDSLFLIPARLLRKPVVIHFHGGHFGMFYERSNLLMKGLIRFSIRRVDRVIVLGEHLRGIVGSLVVPGRVSVVPNGVPVPLCASPENSPIKKGAGFNVLYMGNLWGAKGFFDLLHAVPLVQKSAGEEVRFWLVGDDSFPEARKAQEWVRERNLEHLVNFLGVRVGAEKDAILDAADALVFPSHGPEGQPLVLLEAMAAGLPIVSTRLATAVETLGERGALFVDPRSPAEIAEKLLTLRNDDSLRRDIIVRNRARFTEFYGLDRFAMNLGEVFAEVLDARGIGESSGKGYGKAAPVPARHS
jgi:glycosyltransferase involved in cell wall biosynthesis